MRLILPKQDKRNLLNSGKILHVIVLFLLLLFNKIIAFISYLREREINIRNFELQIRPYGKKYYDKLQNNNNKFSTILIMYNFSERSQKSSYATIQKKTSSILKNLILTKIRLHDRI